MLGLVSELDGCQDSKKSDLVLEDFRCFYEGFRGSEHTNSQYFFPSMSPCMATCTFAK